MSWLLLKLLHPCVADGGMELEHHSTANGPNDCWRSSFFSLMNVIEITVIIFSDKRHRATPGLLRWSDKSKI